MIIHLCFFWGLPFEVGIGSLSIACSCKASNGMKLKVRSCVDRRRTLGANPSLYACSHLNAHRHHWSPGFKPGNPKWSIGVDRSLPSFLENARNSSLTITQTVWTPRSSSLVSQHPDLKKPVIGLKLQGSIGSPSTLSCFSSSRVS